MSQQAHALKALPLAMQDIHNHLRQNAGTPVGSPAEGYAVLRESLDHLWHRIKRRPGRADAETYGALVAFGSHCCRIALRLHNEGILARSADLAAEHITRNQRPPIASLHEGYAVLESWLLGILLDLGEPDDARDLARLRNLLSQVFLVAAELGLCPDRVAPDEFHDAA